MGWLDEQFSLIKRESRGWPSWMGNPNPPSGFVFHASETITEDYQEDLVVDAIEVCPNGDLKLFLGFYVQKGPDQWMDYKVIHLPRSGGGGA